MQLAIIVDNLRIITLRLQLQDILADLDLTFLRRLQHTLLDIEPVHIGAAPAWSAMIGFHLAACSLSVRYVSTTAPGSVRTLMLPAGSPPNVHEVVKCWPVESLPLAPRLGLAYKAVP
jgi:hypothetical protein